MTEKDYSLYKIYKEFLSLKQKNFFSFITKKTKIRDLYKERNTSFISLNYHIEHFFIIILILFFIIQGVISIITVNTLSVILIEIIAIVLLILSLLISFIKKVKKFVEYSKKPMILQLPKQTEQLTKRWKRLSII